MTTEYRIVGERSPTADRFLQFKHVTVVRRPWWQLVWRPWAAEHVRTDTWRFVPRPEFVRLGVYLHPHTCEDTLYYSDGCLKTATVPLLLAVNSETQSEDGLRAFAQRYPDIQAFFDEHRPPTAWQDRPVGPTEYLTPSKLGSL